MKRILTMLTLLRVTEGYSAEQNKKRIREIREIIDTFDVQSFPSIPDFFEKKYKNRAEKITVILGALKLASLHPGEKAHIMLQLPSTIISQAPDHEQQFVYTVKYLGQSKDEALALVRFGGRASLNNEPDRLKDFLGLHRTTPLTIETLIAALIEMCHENSFPAPVAQKSCCWPW